MEPWKEELYLEELYHHGILGQKWGVRRFQNPDGTRTALGKKRYSSFLPDREPSRPSWQGTTKAFERMKRQRGINPGVSRPGSLRPKNKSEKKQLTDEEKAKRRETAKKIAKGVAIGAGVAAAGYGAYKLGKHINKANSEKQARQFRNKLNDYISNANRIDGLNLPTLDQQKVQRDIDDLISISTKSRDKSNYMPYQKVDNAAEKVRKETVRNFLNSDSYDNLRKNNDKAMKEIRGESKPTRPYIDKFGITNPHSRFKVSDGILDVEKIFNTSINSILSAPLDEVDSYTQDLLKKQRRGTASMGKALKLSEMTMDDLRKLDLW